MNMFSLKNVSWIGGVFSGVILGVPLLSSAGLAAPSSRFNNPCPKIYYEEPYNSRLIVPQECPPNAATLNNPGSLRPGAAGVGGSLPGQNRTPNRIVPADAPTTPGTVRRPSIFNEPPYNRANPPGTPITLPVQPPLPEQRSQPIARVTPINGTVSVRLKNDTNVPITIEAVQYTERRALQPRQEVVLQNIPVPLTLTFVRQDNGFVEVIPLQGSGQSVLSLSLDEDATPRDNNQGVVRIQSNGQVFLN